MDSIYIFSVLILYNLLTIEFTTLPSHGYPLLFKVLEFEGAGIKKKFILNI